MKARPASNGAGASCRTLLGLAACLIVLCLGAAPSHAMVRPGLEQAVDAYLQPLLRTNNFSGVILVAQGDEIVLHRAYGQASIEHRVPNRPDTVFQIASVSKPFTAAAIMLLAEQGRVDLRAPLSAILPGYPNGGRLTVHHLLTHTSGIPNINDFPEYADVQRRPHSPEELVAYFRDRPLEFEPASRYAYSNSNYNLLALVVERASGMEFGEFLRSAIFEPLRLQQTGHHGSAAQIVPGLATGYAPAGSLDLERATYVDWSVKTGNGSLYSSAPDLLRFFRAVHEGRLLQPASRSATFTEHVRNVGYGWFLTEANGRAIHHINGRSPGWAAQADYYVEDEVTVIVLANSYISVTTEIARAVGALHFGLAPEPLPALRAEPLAPDAVAALAGAYQFGPDYYVPNALMTVTGNGGYLEATVGDYPPYAFLQIDPNRFLIRSFWIEAEFILGPDGRATELVIDGRRARRVAAPAPADATGTAPELRIEPYAFELADGTELMAERGRFMVPENRDDPNSRKIELGFVRFRSTNPNPGPPIVYLAGGPGGSGVGTARGPRQPIFLELRAVADVIAFDQRGTGFSNHIEPCAAERPLDPGRVLSEATLTAYYAETLQACLPRWRAAGVAVDGYTTEQSADDLEDLRRALGARQIDLWGISYGSHLAFAAMRRHPGSIRRVALASVEGTSQTVKLPAHVDAALERVGRVAGGGLTERMRRVHARFDAEPQSFEFVDEEGVHRSFRADSFPLRMFATYLPKNPDGIPTLVGGYAALEAGETAAVAAPLWSHFYARPLTMSGMPELMDVASGIDEARLEGVRRQARDSLVGTATNFPMPQLRGLVPGLDLGVDFRREIASDHPVLLFQGDLDVRTPLEEQAEAVAGLRDLHTILVRNGGHDLFEAHPDVPALLLDFFAGRPVTVTELTLPAPPQ